MASIQRAQTGNRVYGNMSQSPNRGQVSAKGAQGYIKRELRNKNQLNNQRQNGRPVANAQGGDGKSDMRSAVAAQALNRRGGKKPTGFGGPKDGRRPFLNNDQRQPPTKPGPNSPVATGPGGDPGATQVPQIKVNSAGLLELPYDDTFGQEQYNALAEANDSLLGIKMEQDQQAMEYTRNKRDMGLQYDQLQGQTLNQNAGRGTAFSSQYGNAVANNATSYANQMSDLELANTQALQGFGLQRSAIQNSLSRQLGLGVHNLSNTLAEEAGSLGFGNQVSQIREGRNTSHHQRKNKGKKKRNFQSAAQRSLKKGKK